MAQLRRNGAIFYRRVPPEWSLGDTSSLRRIRWSFQWQISSRIFPGKFGNLSKIHRIFLGVCPLYVSKTCVVHPVFARVVGELSEADPSKCPRGYATKASSGAPRWSWVPGTSHTPDQKTRTASTCWINPVGLSLIFTSQKLVHHHARLLWRKMIFNCDCGHRHQVNGVCRGGG